MNDALPHPLGFVDASGENRDLARTTLGGVPLGLWAVRNMCQAVPVSSVVAACDRPAMAKMFQRGGVRVIEATQAVEMLAETRPDLFARLERPFCLPESANRALLSSNPELINEQNTPLERLRVTSESDRELAEALVRGLGPDHPVVKGVRRFRLPLRDVKAVVCDVDGTLTSGEIMCFGGGSEPARPFNTHDGMGFALLHQAGLKLAWLTATSKGGSTQSRAEMLPIDVVDIGKAHKGERFVRVCERLGVSPEQVVYIGDDVNDLPAMELAGMSACPSDAHDSVRARVDLVLDRRGGFGALRELADLILDGLGGVD
jgi:YrbI family 3-deoxy-D-manno-octulosonate 8-phosphate phosphatase